MIKIFYFLQYFLVFLRELLLSTWSVMKLALNPRLHLHIRPGFVAVPMKAESDLEITFLANSVTLTPGTISVHVDRPNKTLIIHAIDIGRDAQGVRQSIQTTLEASILKWTRAGGKPALQPGDEKP